MDEVGERLFAVHEDDRDAFAVAPLELLVPRDVDLLELEGDVSLDLHEHPARSLAEVAALRVVQRQPMGRAHA